MRGEATRIASVLAVAVLVASFLVVGAAGPAVGNTSGDTGSISGGNNFSCAVTSAGTLKCWGGNTYGQLGDGTTAPQNSPQLVPGLGGVAEVSAGWQHVCVLTTVGGVKCWGLNTAGQVGNGTTATAQTTPVDVVGLGSGVQAISTGAFHTCALTDDGGVKCWGHNLQGALGDGTTSDRSSPIDVIGLESGVSAIAAGDSITCAVLDSGALKCWGNNATGGVGDGTTTNRLTPVGVVGLGAGVASVSAEGTYPFGSRTCAVTTSGAAKCWGTNNQGQLGDGTTTNRRIPTDVVGLGSGVAAISTGASFTCARTIVGAVECWGQYAVGADLSGTVVQTTPLDVIGLGSGVVEMEAGGYHACVRLVSGAIKCWGGNNSGQLGIGTDNGAFGRVPLDVSGSFHRPECPTVVPESRTTFTSTDGYAVGSVLTCPIPASVSPAPQT
jgi:alpha-tubulin suppressor-like RCC1 family protein